MYIGIPVSKRLISNKMSPPNVMASNFMSGQILSGLEPATANVTWVIRNDRRVYINHMLFQIVIGTVGFATLLTPPSPFGRHFGLLQWDVIWVRAVFFCFIIDGFFFHA